MQKRLLVVNNIKHINSDSTTGGPVTINEQSKKKEILSTKVAQ